MPGKNLTRVEAEERAALVSVEAYAVELDLTTSETTFATTSTITFSATEGASTFVDFLGASVEKVTLNGEVVETAYDGNRVAIERYLALGFVVRREMHLLVLDDARA